MPFQFHCPQSHLLEADESQVGQQCQCPMCGALFPIPAPAGVPEARATPFSFHSAPAAETFSFPNVAQGAPAAHPFEQQSSASRFLHIPCPRGHELEVPPEMLGQDVLCPHCQTQFRLRDKDSVEFKTKKRKELELKDYKSGQLWMTWAIVIGVVVLIGLVVMIGISATQ